MFDDIYDKCWNIPIGILDIRNANTTLPFSVDMTGWEWEPFNCSRKTLVLFVYLYHLFWFFDLLYTNIAFLHDPKYEVSDLKKDANVIFCHVFLLLYPEYFRVNWESKCMGLNKTWATSAQLSPSNILRRTSYLFDILNWHKVVRLIWC